MDPTYPDIKASDFPDYDWEHHYHHYKEEIPNNIPEAFGLEMVIRAFVDADHAGDPLTRRSRTGFIVIVNSAPVYWLSKKQNSVETSSFGSEFLAMKHCCEYIRGLRYKIRMMGIPMTHGAFIYGDNQSVLWNTTCPDSVLKKKSNSVAYHFVREGCSANEWKTTYCKTSWNPSDLMTKSIPYGQDRRRKVRFIMYDIYPSRDEHIS